MCGLSDDAPERGPSACPLPRATPCRGAPPVRDCYLNLLRLQLSDTNVYAGRVRRSLRDRYFIAEQPAPAPHLAHPEGCAALRIVLVTVPRVSRSCEHSPDGFDLHLLRRQSSHSAHDHTRSIFNS